MVQQLKFIHARGELVVSKFLGLTVITNKCVRYRNLPLQEDCMRRNTQASCGGGSCTCTMQEDVRVPAHQDNTVR